MSAKTKLSSRAILRAAAELAVGGSRYTALSRPKKTIGRDRAIARMIGFFILFFTTKNARETVVGVARVVISGHECT